jgi:hypothetical protein
MWVDGFPRDIMLPKLTDAMRLRDACRTAGKFNLTPFSRTRR